MELTLKLREILHLSQTLKAIIDDTETKVDALFKFRLLGILRSVELPVTNFETIRNERIREFGTETEDGTIQIPKDDEAAIQKFNDSLREMLNSEVTVTIEKLKAADVFNKGVGADFLMGLYPIIKK